MSPRAARGHAPSFPCLCSVFPYPMRRGSWHCLISPHRRHRPRVLGAVPFSRTGDMSRGASVGCVWVAGHLITGGQRLPTGGHSIGAWWGGLAPRKESCTDGVILREVLLPPGIGRHLIPPGVTRCWVKGGFVTRIFCSRIAGGSLEHRLASLPGQPETGGHVLIKKTDCRRRRCCCRARRD